MPDQTQDPGRIARLIAALKSMGTSAYNALTPRANPQVPMNGSDPQAAAEGKGGAQRRSKLDQQIAEAGG